LLATDVQTALMSFRTDLDSPSLEETYALMAHGYEVAAMHAEHLNAADFSAARSLFCSILADSLAIGNNSSSEREKPLVEKAVSRLSADQLLHCGVRPKKLIVFHLILYLLLLSAVLFALSKYVRPNLIKTYAIYMRSSAGGTITPVKP
jgi:hypothetical protein